MHKIKLSDVVCSETIFTQSVLQITEMLGIYHAELARIIHLRCADIGDISSTQKNIQKNSEAWSQAEKYIQMYECLYQKHNGDETRIYNWLRKENNVLDGVPLYLMVDELRIDDVINNICE